jgi:hypothetical protein
VSIQVEFLEEKVAAAYEALLEGDITLAMRYLEGD